MGIFNVLNKKKRIDTEDFEKDLFSIMEFLASTGKDIKDIYEIGVKVKKARSKERSETDTKKQLKLLEDEIKVWDKFLERYVMFTRDVAITGQRAKKISKVLQEEAAKMDINKDVKDLVKKKDEWVFNW
jgi:uncharacterized protein (UPF0335 family)